MKKQSKKPGTLGWAWRPYARELYEIALAMIDGSYYADDASSRPWEEQNPGSRDPAFWE